MMERSIRGKSLTSCLDLDSGKKCPKHFAELMLRYAITDNPGVQIAMTDQPKVPDIFQDNAPNFTNIQFNETNY